MGKIPQKNHFRLEVQMSIGFLLGHLYLLYNKVYCFLPLLSTPITCTLLVSDFATIKSLYAGGI